MAQHHAELFRSLRPQVLEQLVEVRGSIDHTYATIPDAVIRQQFDLVLEKMQSYLFTGDVEPYRNFASRWMAMRVGGGFAGENLIHSVVAIGDIVIQVARQRLGNVPELAQFNRAVAQMSFLAARLLVEVLADELERRVDARKLLGGGGA